MIGRRTRPTARNRGRRGEWSTEERLSGIPSCRALGLQRLKLEAGGGIVTVLTTKENSRDSHLLPSCRAAMY